MAEALTWTLDATGRDTRWEGGVIRYDKRGRPTFVIERMVQGRRYLVSTRTHTVSAALKRLARFEGDPAGYVRKPVEHDALYLTGQLRDEFLAHSRDVKKNVSNWVTTQRMYLTAWAEDLFGVDLRKLSLQDHVDPILDQRRTGRAQRIKVLKAFMGWLRKVKRVLKHAEDATVDLPVPQARPEQARRMKAIPRNHFELALEHLTGSYRDGLIVLGATGCHYSELVKFIREGSIEPVPAGSNDSAGVLMFRHKTGVPHRVRVGEVALASAGRLKERGVAWDHHRFNAAIRSACASAGVSVFHPGQLRHSVATWAVNAGADPTAVAAFLGHRSTITLKKFYSTHASPARVPTLIAEKWPSNLRARRRT